MASGRKPCGSNARVNSATVRARTGSAPFGRNTDGSINFEDPPIFGDITSDPAFDRIRMIAEPWDAAGRYELGRAFPGITWLQWNSRFRDDVRRCVRGDDGMLGA